jgi:hypothetical protein
MNKIDHFCQIVLIRNAGSDDSNKVPASKRPKPRPVFTSGSKRADSTAAEQATPLRGKGVQRTLSLRGNISSPIVTTTPTGPGDVASLSISPGDSGEGLPQFVRSAWASQFLPTLYAYLGSLEKPWELAEPGSDEVQTIQMLVDLVYPQSGYKVQLNDKIYNMVCIFFLPFHLM